MDPKLEEIKLTNFGLRLKLIKFSPFLSVLGIVGSVLGLVGGILFIIESWHFYGKISEIEGYGYTGDIETLEREYLMTSMKYLGSAIVLLILSISYLVMWILLIIKTRKRNINGIQNIARVYCYCSCVVEVVLIIALIYGDCMTCMIAKEMFQTDWAGRFVSFLALLAIGGGCISFLKVLGLTHTNRKLFRLYLCLRYILFLISFITIIIGLVYSMFMIWHLNQIQTLKLNMIYDEWMDGSEGSYFNSAKMKELNDKLTYPNKYKIRFNVINHKDLEEGDLDKSSTIEISEFLEIMKRNTPTVYSEALLLSGNWNWPVVLIGFIPLLLLAILIFVLDMGLPVIFYSIRKVKKVKV